MKIAVLLRSARSALRSEARELFLIAPRARTQSERAPSARVSPTSTLIAL